MCIGAVVVWPGGGGGGIGAVDVLGFGWRSDAGGGAGGLLMLGGGGGGAERNDCDAAGPLRSDGGAADPFVDSRG